MDRIDRWQAHVEALTQQPAHVTHQTHGLEVHTRMIEQRFRWWRALACGVALLLGEIGIALGSVTLAHADVIQCGDVLGPGGRFELEHDLECGFPAVTVRDGAILDLNGHIVACRPSLNCIILTGRGAQLLNGVVRGQAGHQSIFLEDQSGHTVKNVTSLVTDANVIVSQSDHNQLINVMAESGFNAAFTIAGNHNRLTGSIARCFGLVFSGCIFVRGNENRLSDNFVTSTADTTHGAGGFEIRGNNNVLERNRVIRNEGPGIVVTGSGNILRRNTAFENSPDLQDTSGDCAHNTWRQNTFETSDPECIQNPGPSAHDVVELP